MNGRDLTLGLVAGLALGAAVSRRGSAMVWTPAELDNQIAQLQRGIARRKKEIAGMEPRAGWGPGYARELSEKREALAYHEQELETIRAQRAEWGKGSAARGSAARALLWHLTNRKDFKPSATFRPVAKGGWDRAMSPTLYATTSPFYWTSISGGGGGPWAKGRKWAAELELLPGHPPVKPENPLQPQTVLDPRFVRVLRVVPIEEAVREETGYNAKGEWVGKPQGSAARAASAMGRYRFVTNCIGSTYEDISAMKETATGVSRATFAKALGPEQWKWVQKSLGYDRDFRISGDWHVGYDKGTYRGVPAYWLTHSGIEWIFTLDGEQGKSLGRRGSRSTGGTYFHVTTIDGANAILRDGFRAGPGICGRGVYLWDDLWYAQQMAQDEGDDAVILAVNPEDTELYACDEADVQDEGDSAYYDHVVIARVKSRWKPKMRVVE